MSGFDVLARRSARTGVAESLLRGRKTGAIASPRHIITSADATRNRMGSLPRERTAQMPAHPEPQIAKDFLERGLDCVARSVVRRPRTWLIAYSALALVSALVAIKWLDFETDQNELISNDLDYNRRYLAYLDEFGDQEPMFCCIDARRCRSRALRVDHNRRRRKIQSWETSVGIAALETITQNLEVY